MKLRIELSARTELFFLQTCNDEEEDAWKERNTT